MALVRSALTLLFCAFAAIASAQTCGDADGSGTVTVTDGVQTLRAAAGLASSCTPERCDVDASGSVTVSDGVNVLRKAAGLSAPEACPGGSDADAQVQETIAPVLPFFAFGLDFASDVSLASRAAAGPAANVEDCPAGGSRLKDFTGAVLRIEFQACGYASPGLGSFRFDRRILVNFLQSQVAFSFDVTDVGSGRLVSFEGLFAFVPRSGGGFVADGAITLTTPQGDFALVVNDLEVDDDGHVVAGGGSITDSDDAFDLEKLDFQVTGAATATLTATFDDGSVRTFGLNLVTGDLTPA